MPGHVCNRKIPVLTFTADQRLHHWTFTATKKTTFTADKKNVYGRQNGGTERRLRQTKKRLRQTTKLTFTADKEKDVYGRQRKGRLRQTRKGTFTADKEKDVYGRQ